MPAIGQSKSENASKLKLSKTALLSQPNTITEASTLTVVGKGVQAASGVMLRLYAAPRMVMHAGVIGLVGMIVLGSSTGHPAKLNPLASQIGYGSVLDQAAAASVAATVADQTHLLVTQEIDTTAKTLNEQISLPTTDDATLAKRQVVDTAGPTARGVSTYTVAVGDTMSGIAAQFNITTDTVRWANGLSQGVELKPGQALTILPVSGVRYRVLPGETAQALAERFHANADQIVAFNNSEVSGLQAGQVVIIPDGIVEEAAPAPASSRVASQAAAASSVSTPVKFTRGGPNGYAYGYCTWYVANRRAVPAWWGNAASWYSNARISGYSVGSAPQPGAIAWSGAGYYGHVAYVEGVSGGMVTVSEMNWNGNWNRATSRTVPASSFRYIY